MLRQELQKSTRFEIQCNQRYKEQSAIIFEERENESSVKLRIKNFGTERYNKQHLRKVLLGSFHLNGHTLGFSGKTITHFVFV